MVHVKCLAQGSAYRICLMNDGSSDGKNSSGVMVVMMMTMTVIQKLDVVTGFQPFYLSGRTQIVFYCGQYVFYHVIPVKCQHLWVSKQLPSLHIRLVQK